MSGMWNNGSPLVIYVAAGILLDRLRRERVETRRLATTDDLTGLANARHFRAELRREIARADRYHRSLALLLFDCDGPKGVNDRFGHGVGNQMLRQIGRTLAEVVRGPDLAARWGGDEFGIVQPEGTTETALAAARRIVTDLEAWSGAGGTGEPIAIRLSIGVATYPDPAQDEESLFSAADRALYAAKRAGGDRIEVAPAGERAPQ